jgi:SecD/SecF fusion protein
MCIYGVMMWLNPTMQVDVIFIIALLTTMWYSITDTVVIFDRVREHIENDKNRNMAEIFENSLRETMTRSLMTWSGTLLSIIAMYLLWTWDLKSFAFTMFFGILSGTVSSIFLASPLAYLIIKYSGKHK